MLIAKHYDRLIMMQHNRDYLAGSDFPWREVELELAKRIKVEAIGIETLV